MSRYRGVSGVNREVAKRYRSVGGVNREITKGWRGVSGVNRKYFSSDCTVTITGTGDSDKSCVTINGTTYTSPATLTVPSGTIATCRVRGATGWDASITFNDFIVASGGRNTPISYELVLDKDATIELEVAVDGSYSCGYIRITN